MSYGLEFNNFSQLFHIIKTKLTISNLINFIKTNKEVCCLSTLIIIGIGISKLFAYNRSVRKFNKISDIRSGKFYFLEGKVLYRYIK